MKIQPICFFYFLFFYACYKSYCDELTVQFKMFGPCCFNWIFWWTDRLVLDFFIYVVCLSPAPASSCSSASILCQHPINYCCTEPKPHPTFLHFQNITHRHTSQYRRSVLSLLLFYNAFDICSVCFVLFSATSCSGSAHL